MTASLRTVAMLFKYIQQSTYDLFFIDWEKPKLEKTQGYQ